MSVPKLTNISQYRNGILLYVYGTMSVLELAKGIYQTSVLNQFTGKLNIL